MKSPTPKHLLNLMELLDWTGHVELPYPDMVWLANSIAADLHPEHDMCSACGKLDIIIVHTPLGNMCEECIEEASDEADEIREDLEDKVR